jgi:hypothetical protein
MLGTAPMSAETLAALSPTAAATSSFLKSGMTLTQVAICTSQPMYTVKLLGHFRFAAAAKSSTAIRFPS